ncbi:MAG: hypothetical protein KBC72_04225 [Acinetobacter sp.]|nr:hypothetical protein [Acinetobacter sp.]
MVIRKIKEIEIKNTALFVPLSLAYISIIFILICICSVGFTASIIAFFLHILEIQSIFTKYEILYSLEWWSYPLLSLSFYVVGKALYWVMKLPFGDLEKN